MENNLEIHIVTEFAKTLGARYKYEGKFSGEEFLERLLLPRFLRAEELNVKLLIFLDGVFGYPSSFVSGSFGKLSIDQGAEKVLKRIDLISTNPLRKEKILIEIKQPKKK